MAKADPRLALSEEQRRGAAGLASRKRTDEEERRRKERLAAARAERARRRKEREEAARKRAERSREVAAESKPAKPIVPKPPETRATAARTGLSTPGISNPLKGRVDRSERKTIAELTREAEGRRASSVLPGGIVKRGIRDLEDFATNLPAALYMTGKAVVSDVKKGAELDPRPFLDPREESETADLVGAMAKQMASDYRHPLRYAQEHPGFFALDALALASMGAGGSARLGAAGRATKAGEGIRGALARPTSEGGSLLNRPPPGVRVHRYEGRPIRGRYSRDALARAIQKSRDKATGGKIGGRKASKLIAEERRILDASERVEALRVLADSKKTSTPEQLAIQVVAEGLPIDDVIAAELRMAENMKGRASRRHRRMAELLEGAREYVTVNSKGRAVFRREHKDLARKMRTAERAVRKREAGLERAGLLTDEQVRYRENAPGRVMLGAKWEPRPLSETGTKQPFQLVGKRVRTRDGVRGVITDLEGDVATVRPWSKKAGGPFTASLDDLFPASKTAKGRLVGGGRAVQYERPRTLAEAEARVAELEAKVESVEERIAKALMERNPDKYPSRGYAIGPSGPKKAGRKVAEHEIPRTRAGKVDIAKMPGGAYVEQTSNIVHAKRGRTGKELALEDAQKILAQRAGKSDAHPLYRAYAAAQKELDDLRTAILAEKEAGTPFEGTTVQYLYHGTTPERAAAIRESGVLKPNAPFGGSSKTPNVFLARTAEEAQKYGPEVVRVRVSDIPPNIGGAPLSRRLARGGDIAIPAEIKIAPEHPLGTVTEAKVLEAFEGGRFRVPEFTQDKPWLMRRPQQWQGGIPRKPATVTQPYTGALRRSGKRTKEPLRAIAEDALQAERLLDVERLRRRVVRFGQRARPADTRRVKYAPVRVRKLKPEEAKALREALRDAEIEKLTPDEAARIEMAYKNFEQTAFPEGVAASVGQEIPGVVWVDRRLISSQRKLIPGGYVPVADEMADAVKGAILYLKPGYVAPNVIGNATFNIFQQGFLAPANWIRQARLPKDIAYGIDEVVGQGFAASLAAGTRSPISAGVQKMGAAWGVFVDKPFRRAAVLHEMRLAGAKTNRQMRDLLTNPKRRQELAEVVQRGRDAIIDYERLSPVEQDIVRRAIFVYPWLRGSAHYAVQFFRDHPIQAAVYARLGRDAASQSEADLGALPSWMTGSFKVGGSKESPLVVNPRFVNPLETMAEALGVTQGTLGLKQAGRTERIGQSVHPLFKAGIETAFGRDLFTGEDIQPGPTTFLERLGRQFPQYQTLERHRDLGTEQEGKARPVESWYDVAAPFVIGSAAPRKTNLAVVNRQAEDERKRFLTAEQRLREKHLTEQQAVTATLRASQPELFKKGSTLPKRLRQAYSRWTQVELMRDRVERELPVGEKREREKLRREAKLLRKWGAITPAKTREILAVADKGSEQEVASWRGTITYYGFEEAYRGLLNEAREATEYGG